MLESKQNSADKYPNHVGVKIYSADKYRYPNHVGVKPKFVFLDVVEGTNRGTFPQSFGTVPMTSRLPNE